jgi:acyl carrier protein
MTLTREAIMEHVNQTLVDEFEIKAENLSSDKRLREDLELDSLDAVDMIVALEQSLKIRVDEDEAKRIRTVGDIYDFVEKMLSTSKKPPAVSISAP